LRDRTIRTHTGATAKVVLGTPHAAGSTQGQWTPPTIMDRGCPPKLNVNPPMEFGGADPELREVVAGLHEPRTAEAAAAGSAPSAPAESTATEPGDARLTARKGIRGRRPPTVSVRTAAIMLSRTVRCLSAARMLCQRAAGRLRARRGRRPERRIGRGEQLRAHRPPARPRRVEQGRLDREERRGVSPEAALPVRAHACPRRGLAPFSRERCWWPRRRRAVQQGALGRRSSPSIVRVGGDRTESVRIPRAAHDRCDGPRARQMTAAPARKRTVAYAKPTAGLNAVHNRPTMMLERKSPSPLTVARTP